MPKSYKETVLYGGGSSAWQIWEARSRVLMAEAHDVRGLCY